MSAARVALRREKCPTRDLADWRRWRSTLRPKIPTKIATAKATATMLFSICRFQRLENRRESIICQVREASLPQMQSTAPLPTRLLGLGWCRQFRGVSLPWKFDCVTPRVCCVGASVMSAGPMSCRRPR